MTKFVVDSIVRDSQPIAAKRAVDSDGAGQLAHEAQVLAEIDHPAVTQLISFERIDGQLTLLTEYAGRTNLQQWTPPTVEALISISVALLDALLEIHDRGWAHGSIEASHCLVGQRGRVTLCSWGLAQRLEGGGARAVRKDFSSLGSALIPLTFAIPDGSLLGQIAQRRRLGRVETLLDALAHGVDRAGAERIRSGLAAIKADRRASPPHQKRQPSEQPTPLVVDRTKQRQERKRREAVGWLQTAGLLILVSSCLVALLVKGPHADLLSFFGTGSDPDAPGGGDPTMAVVELLRWLAIGGAVYLLVALIAASVARLTSHAAAIVAAQRLTLRPLRRVSAFIVGAGVVSGAVMSSGANGGHEPVAIEASIDPLGPFGMGEAATGRIAEFESDGTDRNPAGSGSRLGEPAARQSGHGAASGTSTVAELQFDHHPVIQSTGPNEIKEPEAHQAKSTEWTVEAGDHLWHIAEATLTERYDSNPSEADVATYWRQLIEFNRATFIDPDNPDLLHRGQVIELP